MDFFAFMFEEVAEHIDFLLLCMLFVGDMMLSNGSPMSVLR